MTRQDMVTYDRIRLEVQATRTGLANYVKNPDGRMYGTGGWGWLTPRSGTTVDWGFAFPGLTGLEFIAVSGIGGSFRSEPTPIAPGRSCGARMDVITSNATLAIRIVFHDADSNEVGVGAQSATVPANTNAGTIYAPVATAPAGAASFAVRGDVVVSGALTSFRVDFTKVHLTHSASTVPATFPYADPIQWVNIMGPTHEITIDREALSPGVLTAVVYDATLDPSQTDLVQPGKAVRVYAADAAQPIFTGTLTRGDVVYDVTQPKPSRRAKITLTAVDNIAKLANVKRPNGVASISDLADLLEGAGTPWRLDNGITGSQSYTPTYVAVNKNASLLDQIAITRDSVRGYAWCNRYGILVAAEPGAMANLTQNTQATLAETDYTGLDTGYSTTDCINVVTIKLVRPDPTTGESVEVIYGPYRNQASIDARGAFEREFRVQGLSDNPTAIANYANAILAANATPKNRVNAMRLAIRTVADLSKDVGSKRALLDLYDRVTITRADPINDPFPTTFTPNF